MAVKPPVPMWCQRVARALVPGDPLRRVPVRTLGEVSRLPHHEIDAGYDAGMRGQPCPETASRAYWHGWRCGMFESYRMPRDEAAKALLAQGSKFEPYRDGAWVDDEECEIRFRRRC